MAAIKPPQAKIQLIEDRYQHFKQKSKQQSLELKSCRARIVELQDSRASWKAKSLAYKQDHQVRSNSGFLPVPRPRGHRYSVYVIELCLKLYLLCNCSLRGVSSVIELLFGKACTPCKSTISNWIRKSGYYIYSRPVDEIPSGGYGLILDESMVIGQERMMCGLLIKGDKKDDRALKISDVVGLLIGVKPSWKAVDIIAFVKSLPTKISQNIKYIISDCDSTLLRAITDLGITRICDVGHQMGRFLEQTYKLEPDFQVFSKDLAQLKFREIMKPTAYLLPPKARTIARFMNLSASVQWAEKILDALPTLSSQEQEVFGFIRTHAPLIKEQAQIFEWLNPLLKTLKEKGLSTAHIQLIDQQLEQVQKQTKQERAKAFIKRIRQYLNEEQQKLPDDEITIHMSSDIIESCFGIHKARQSPNKLNGVTSSVFLLALMTKVDTELKRLELDIKKAMEDVSLAKVLQWADKHLIQNQVRRRIKTLKK